MEAPVASGRDFETFFRVEYPRVRQALYVLIGRLPDAEELAQEAFARVFERWQRVSVMDAPEGYVYRIAVNLWRKWGVRPERKMAPIEAASRMASPGEANETRVLIREAMLLLSTEQQEALVVVEWLGFSSEEAGEILGIRPSSVRARVHRAKATLKDSLAEVPNV